MLLDRTKIIKIQIINPIKKTSWKKLLKVTIIYTNNLDEFKFVLFKNLVDNLKEFCELSTKLNERNKIFWTSIKIRPKPNSTADNIRKKNVSDNIFKLSNIKPRTKDAEYRVIHNNSAVKRRCSAVFTLITILAKKKKKKRNIIFNSPMLIIYN